jgi:hypothetical protein
MTDTMIERVARQWCNFENPSRYGPDGVDAWTWMSHLREEYVEKLRLIVLWMREPTEAVRCALYRAGEDEELSTEERWAAGIDAALAEEG